MTFDEYRKIDKLNASLIKEGSKSIWHAWMALNTERKPSPSMTLGTAIHCAILEPLEFSKRYAVMTEGFDRRTKEGKEKYSKFCLENEGKETISSEDNFLIEKIKFYINKNESIKNLLNKCEKEKTLEKKNIKARLDLFNDDLGIVADIKTADNIDPKSFKYDFYKYGYDIQLYHYSLFLNSPKKVLILAIETGTGHSTIFDVTKLVLNERVKELHMIGIQNVLEAKNLKYEPKKYEDFLTLEQ